MLTLDKESRTEKEQTDRLISFLIQLPGSYISRDDAMNVDSKSQNTIRLG